MLQEKQFESVRQLMLAIELDTGNEVLDVSVVADSSSLTLDVDAGDPVVAGSSSCDA